MRRRTLAIVVPVGTLIVTFLIFLGLHLLNAGLAKSAPGPGAAVAATRP
jgi:hypothetical protein